MCSWISCFLWKYFPIVYFTMKVLVHRVLTNFLLFNYVMDHLWIYYMKHDDVVAQIVKNLPAMQKTQVRSLGREDLLEKGIATHYRILPKESHGQRSLVGYSAWDHRESDMTEWLILSLSCYQWVSLFVLHGKGNGLCVRLLHWCWVAV